MVVGAGEMAALALQALRVRRGEPISMSSVAPASALTPSQDAIRLRRRHGASGRALENATPSSSPRARRTCPTAEDFALASDARPVVVDISVPRAVDPAVRSLAGLRLYDIDDPQATALWSAKQLRQKVRRSRWHRIVTNKLAAQSDGDAQRACQCVAKASSLSPRRESKLLPRWRKMTICLDGADDE